MFLAKHLLDLAVKERAVLLSSRSCPDARSPTRLQHQPGALAQVEGFLTLLFETILPLIQL